MQQESYITKFRLISGIDLYGLLFFVSELLIMHSDEHLKDKYAITLIQIKVTRQWMI